MYQSDQSTVSFLQAVEHSLKSVRLFDDGVADKSVAKYSGGMKRRLSVAISLIGDPKVLVFTYLTIIQETECISCTVRKSGICGKAMWNAVFLVQFAHVKGCVFGAFCRLFTWTNQAPDWTQRQGEHCGML